LCHGDKSILIKGLDFILSPLPVSVRKNSRNIQQKISKTRVYIDRLRNATIERGRSVDCLFMSASGRGGRFLFRSEEAEGIATIGSRSKRRRRVSRRATRQYQKL